MGGCCWHLVGRGQRSCERPAVRRTASTAENCPHGVRSAEAGKVAWWFSSLVMTSIARQVHAEPAR